MANFMDADQITVEVKQQLSKFLDENKDKQLRDFDVHVGYDYEDGIVGIDINISYQK